MDYLLICSNEKDEGYCLGKCSTVSDFWDTCRAFKPGTNEIED